MHGARNNVNSPWTFPSRILPWLPRCRSSSVLRVLLLCLLATAMVNKDECINLHNPILNLNPKLVSSASFLAAQRSEAQHLLS